MAQVKGIDASDGGLGKKIVTNNSDGTKTLNYGGQTYTTQKDTTYDPMANKNTFMAMVDAQNNAQKGGLNQVYDRNGNYVGGIYAPQTETPTYEYSEPSYEAPSEGGGFDYMSYFNQLMDSLNSNYNNLYNMLQQNLADSKASLNANNEESLRQAYINYMMNKRNMQRDMDENGINGGAAETTLARMYNDYGTNRRLINAQTEEQLRQLMQGHNANMASVAQNQANNQLSAQLALAQMMK